MFLVTIIAEILFLEYSTSWEVRILGKNRDKSAVGEMEVSLNFDTTPILYTDNISMTANDDGVTLDVMQRVGSSPQARIVARVGMSREHAKKFVSQLGKLLISTEGKSSKDDKLLN